VTTLAPRDEVFGIGVGSFAEFARASQAKLAQASRPHQTEAGSGV
jgi:hypothetical protein